MVTIEDGEQVTSPALTFETFCQSDRNAIYRTLAGIPELWVRVHQELPVKTQGTERVTMSRSAPVPPNLSADALLREILAVLSSWDERLRMDAGLTLPDTQLSRHRRDPVVLTASVRLLTVHLDRLLALPADAMSRSFSLYDLAKIPEGAYGRSNRIAGYAEVTVDLSGADAGEEILRLSHRARSFLGETRMRERLDVPCPDPACDLLMLERVQGSDYAAECGACGRLLTENEYGSWVRLYAATITTAELDARKTVA